MVIFGFLFIRRHLLYECPKNALQSWIQASSRMLLVFLGHLIISRTAPQDLSTLHKTFDLRSWFASTTLPFAQEILLSISILLYFRDSCVWSPSARPFFRFTAESVVSAPLWLPSYELLSISIDLRDLIITAPFRWLCDRCCASESESVLCFDVNRSTRPSSSILVSLVSLLFHSLTRTNSDPSKNVRA